MLDNAKSFIYDISIRGLSHPERFESEVIKAINEINYVVGWDKNTRINLEPVSLKKNEFLIEILTEVEGHPILVSKTGKMVFPLLKNAKKLAIKQAREVYNKNLRKKRLYGSSDYTAFMMWDAS